MAFNGTGTFLRIMDWTTDAANGVKIRADRHDQEMDDYASGLSNTLTKDGQTQPTANIPMNGHKIIDLGLPTDATDAASKIYVDGMNDFTDGINVTGKVIFYDGAIIRGQIYTNIGAANPAAMYFEINDAAAALKNKMKLHVGGLEFTAGDLLWTDGAATPKTRSAVRGVRSGSTLSTKVEAWLADGTAVAGYIDVNDANFGAYNTFGTVRFGKANGVARGLISAETTANAGVVTIQALNNDQSLANSAIMDNDSFEIKNGAFVSRNGGSSKRADFGFDATFGTSIIYRDSGGQMQSQVTLNALGFYMRGPTGSVAAFRGVGVNGNTRGLIKFNTENSDPSLAQIFTYQANSTKTQVFEIDAAGARLTDGASAGAVLTEGNVNYKGTTAGNVDFPIGTEVLFTCPTGSEVNRNQPLTLRINTLDNFSYRHTGSGTLLTGTWLNSGINASSQLGLGRRTA